MCMPGSSLAGLCLPQCILLLQGLRARAVLSCHSRLQRWHCHWSYLASLLHSLCCCELGLDHWSCTLNGQASRCKPAQLADSSTHLELRAWQVFRSAPSIKLSCKLWTRSAKQLQPTHTLCRCMASYRSLSLRSASVSGMADADAADQPSQLLTSVSALHLYPYSAAIAAGPFQAHGASASSALPDLHSSV